ncbi:MAG: hypothetical protein II782_04530 [Oscillospiraceae bacterium]|nr:hypothetical protein [Oscillospiraceae bacterium]
MHSEFWYKRTDIPPAEKLRIKEMVKGEEAGMIEFSGVRTILFRVSGDVFWAVFALNREYLCHGEFTAPAEDNDYDVSDNYLTADGLAGFSITKTGWLTSLFSNYREKGFGAAVKPYITNARRLVCIVGENSPAALVSFYEREYGFRKCAATVNDTEIMQKYYGDEYIDAFTAHNGKPYHVFMIRSDCYKHEDIKIFGDYFEAEGFVENIMV